MHTETTNQQLKETLDEGKSQDQIAAEWLLSEIKRLVFTYWEQPDWEGLEIILAFLGAFRLEERVPFWLHVVGGPSSGKTELGFAPIEGSGLRHKPLDTITAQTFMSGYTGGAGKENSYLHRIGDSGLIWAKDFTTFLEQPETIVRTVGGQLRSIYDGTYSKETGVANPDSVWEGKLSIITAMTPTAFESWTMLNAMGERFMSLMWKGHEGGEAYRRRIIQQQMSESELNRGRDKNVKKALNPRQEISALTSWLVDGMEGVQEWPDGFSRRADVLRLQPNEKKPKLDVEMVLGSGLFEVGEAVALLRTFLKRKKNQIGMVTTRESPGRIHHQLLKAVRGWAFLNRRDVEVEDFRIARRLAIDSIPIQRRKIIKTMIGKGWISLGEIKEEAKYVHLNPLEDDMIDLLALEAVTPRQATLEGASAEFSLTEKFERLLEKGKELL